MPERVDWSGLPLELLQTIAWKITHVSDYIRFGAVCLPWRSAATPGHLPPQFPWLMFPPDRAAPEFRYSYSGSEGRYCYLHLPEARGKRIQGSAHGWMIAFDDESLSLSLLNPLTRAEIQLPRLIPEDHAIRREKQWISFFKGAIFASNPALTSDSSVVALSFALHPGVMGLAFCRSRDGRWSPWTMICTTLFPLDFTYYNGEFFTVLHDGRAAVVDADTLKMGRMVMPLKEDNAPCRTCFVVSSSELLLVRRYDKGRDPRPRFEVFQLDRREENTKWVGVTTLGDRALFLDDYHGLCFAAGDRTGIRRNCIYFTANDNVGGRVRFCLIYVFDMGDGSIHESFAYWNNNPSAKHAATWIAPSLC